MRLLKSIKPYIERHIMKIRVLLVLLSLAPAIGAMNGPLFDTEIFQEQASQPLTQAADNATFKNLFTNIAGGRVRTAGNCIKQLQTSRFDFNKTNDKGQNALHAALVAKVISPTLIEMLLKEKVDANAQNLEGKSAIDLLNELQDNSLYPKLKKIFEEYHYVVSTSLSEQPDTVLPQPAAPSAVSLVTALDRSTMNGVVGASFVGLVESDDEQVIHPLANGMIGSAVNSTVEADSEELDTDTTDSDKSSDKENNSGRQSPAETGDSELNDPESNDNGAGVGLDKSQEVVRPVDPTTAPQPVVVIVPPVITDPVIAPNPNANKPVIPTKKSFGSWKRNGVILSVLTSAIVTSVLYARQEYRRRKQLRQNAE